MTKNRIALLGSATAVLLCGAGLASAQDCGRDYDRQDDRPMADETIIVRPPYDRVEKRQLLGHINGEVNRVELSISRPVSFSDLNLSNDADYIALHERVHNAARELCAELDARYPELRGDASADRQCVHTATPCAICKTDGGFKPLSGQRAGHSGSFLYFRKPSSQMGGIIFP